MVESWRTRIGSRRAQCSVHGARWTVRTSAPRSTATRWGVGFISNNIHASDHVAWLDGMACASERTVGDASFYWRVIVRSLTFSGFRSTASLVRCGENNSIPATMHECSWGMAMGLMIGKITRFLTSNNCQLPCMLHGPLHIIYTRRDAKANAGSPGS